jgi:hypothetical protein
VFDLYGNDRLNEWKRFRNQLEVSDSPLEDTANYWAKAPFVNNYLDPHNPNSWPDPWHLVLDGKFDNLAICLGMLYTLKLTNRFIDSKCEIHKAMSSDVEVQDYFLIVDKQSILNFEYNNVVDISYLDGVQTRELWSVNGSL